jgi:hypothetical protein
MAHDLQYNKAVLDLTLLVADIEQAVATTKRHMEELGRELTTHELAIFSGVTPERKPIYDSNEARCAARAAQCYAEAVNVHSMMLFELYYLLEATKRPVVTVLGKLSSTDQLPDEDDGEEQEIVVLQSAEQRAGPCKSFNPNNKLG